MKLPKKEYAIFYCGRCERKASARFTNCYPIDKKVVDWMSYVGYRLERIFVCGGCIDPAEIPFTKPNQVENGQVVYVDFKTKKVEKVFDIIEGYAHNREIV